MLISGLIIIAIALFAQLLGLDNDPGWGKGRFILLIVGILTAGVSYYSRYPQRLPAVMGEIQQSIHQTIKRKIVSDNWIADHSHLLVVPCLLIVLFFYFWLTSSERWNNWASPTYYYANLTEGFVRGELHLPIDPDPRLLALDNPYDPLARAGIETPVDLSLYEGKFYMYWGPVPALLLTALHPFFHGPIGDLFLTFAFVCGIFLVQSFLLMTLWDQYFRSLPQWTLYMSIVLGGLTGPITLLRHNYDPPRIYEASIAGGQFFLISGLLMALSALFRPSNSNWRLGLAGILWALAIGTRQVLAAPIGFMVIMLAFRLAKANKGWFKRTVKLIHLGLPLALGITGLGWYNWARFGLITETGLHYQLAGPDLQAHYTELFSLSYVIQNIYNYIFNPLDILPGFPFVFMLKGSKEAVLPSYAVPEFYNAQPITGLLYIFPFAVFALVPLITIFSHLFTNKSADSLTRQDQTLPVWLLLTLTGCFSIAFCLLSSYFWVGMRFLGDFMPSLTVLSVLGFWMGYQFLVHKPLPKLLYAIFGFVVTLTSILLSTLLAVSTNSRLINVIFRNFPFLK